MKVGFVQTKPKLFDVEGNVERALKLASKVDAEILVLPEMFNCGYNFRDMLEVESVAENARDGYTIGRAIEFSKKNDVCLVGGFAEKKAGRIFNSAFVVDRKLLGVYRKVHLYNNEKKFFSPGSEFSVFKTRGIRIGVMVCFDWIFPEAARTLALKGADIIAHPANLVLPYCPEAMKTRCLENKVYAVTADRVGMERGLKFIGRSQIVGPDCKQYFRAGESREEVKAVDLDLTKSRKKKINRLNDLFADRRTWAYKTI